MRFNVQDVNMDDPQDITGYLALEYYKDNYAPFIAFLHPDVLFLSVGKNHIIEGIENLQKTFEGGKYHQFENAVQYKILSISSKKQKVSKTVCNVLVEMQILTKYVTGEEQEVNQRITVNWCKFNKLKFSPKDIRAGWFAMQIHVSVGIEPLRPTSDIHHLAPSMATQTSQFCQEDNQYMIRDCNRFEHYIRPRQIIRIEAKDAHSYVYLQNGCVLKTRKGLQEFEEELSEKGFIRIHKSYIVNRFFVEGVRNYKLVMTDGKVFPVPKGKFQEVKEKMKKKQSNCATKQSK